MSYQPPSDQGGGQSGQDQGGYSEQPQTGNTQPVGGGYGQPPSGGGYGSPPPSGGGYSAPPPSGGGYGAPPPGGGYSPPPAGGGGYSPPPSGGYGGPPPGGGYGAPPPPPTGGGGMGSMGGMDQAGLASLAQSWLNALTKPNVSTYEGELRNASWMKVAIGIGLVTIVGVLIRLLFAGAAGASLAQLDQQIEQMRSQGNTTGVQILEAMRGAAGSVAGGSILSALIGPLIGFFVGAGLLYLLARLFGGQGSDFLTHSYLLSLSYTPTRVLASLLGIVPLVGSCVAIVLYLYQIYSAGLAMQASQRMQPGRAQMAAFGPLVLLFVLGCLCVVAIVALAAAAVGSSNK